MLSNYRWTWSFFLLLDAAATVDVLTASNDDVKLKLSSPFKKINKLDCDYSYWQILSLVCHLKVHVTLLLLHQS